MKCPHCGNNLNIEDKFCPYCGQPNTFAEKHQKEMARFEKDYKATKKEVLEESSRYNRHTVRITILAVMVALIAVMIILLVKMDDFRWWYEERTVAANAPEHIAQIEQLMDERDYLGVYSYFGRNRLSYNKAFRDYDAVYDTSSQYRMFYNNLMTLQAKRTNPEMYKYTTESELIEDIAENVSRFYEAMKPDDYNAGAYADDKMVYMEDARDHMEAMISGYFSISIEEVQGMRQMTMSRINVLLEDSYEQ